MKNDRQALHRAFDREFTRASDGITDHPLLIIAGLLALWKIMKKRKQEPVEYDLTKYKPKPREW